jgi:hypothetical protein
LLTQVETAAGEQRDDEPREQGLNSAVTDSANTPMATTEPASAPLPSLNNASGLATTGETPVAPRQLVPHRYDERRFGSQQALLELLQRQRESGKSAMSLIEIILN